MRARVCRVVTLRAMTMTTVSRASVSRATATATAMRSRSRSRVSRASAARDEDNDVDEKARDLDLDRGPVRSSSSRRATLVALATTAAVTVTTTTTAARASSSSSSSSSSSLERYADEKKAFAVSYPSSWVVASKPGAEVLFKNPDEKYSNIGVTVSPVTIDSLEKFGTLEEIGERLARAEAAKESTVPGGVAVTSSTERRGEKSGAVFYDYEYRLITTYGNKRVYTSVSIVDGTLYILNAQAYETADPERPTEEQKAKDEENSALYRRVGATFDASRRIFES